MCIELGFWQVIFEDDSLRVVQAVRQASPCLSSFGHLIDAIHARLLKLHQYEVQHVFREAKCVAHNLVKLAISSSLDQFWLDDCLLAE